jgi:ferredoxin
MASWQLALRFGGVGRRRHSWNLAENGLMISSDTPFDKFCTFHQSVSGEKSESGFEATMPSVKFVNEKKTIEVPVGANLRQEALKAGVELYPGIHRHFFANCHGLGQCASCCVKIKKGKENVSPQTFRERARMILGMFTSAARKGHEDELRLACLTRVNGDVEIETKPDIMNLHGERFWG